MSRLEPVPAHSLRPASCASSSELRFLCSYNVYCSRRRHKQRVVTLVQYTERTPTPHTRNQRTRTSVWSTNPHVQHRIPSTIAASSAPDALTQTRARAAARMKCARRRPRGPPAAADRSRRPNASMFTCHDESAAESRGENELNTTGQCVICRGVAVGRDYVTPMILLDVASSLPSSSFKSLPSNQHSPSAFTLAACGSGSAVSNR